MKKIKLVLIFSLFLSPPLFSEKESCIMCKNTRLCRYCQGVDLTKLTCEYCWGQDMTKMVCEYCLGTKKIEGEICFMCHGAGKKDTCVMCRGTGKRSECCMCDATGKCTYCTPQPVKPLQIVRIETRDEKKTKQKVTKGNTKNDDLFPWLKPGCSSSAYGDSKAYNFSSRPLPGEIFQRIRAEYTRGSEKGYKKVSGGLQRGEAGMMEIAKLGIIYKNNLYELWTYAHLVSESGKKFFAVIEFPEPDDRKLLREMKNCLEKKGDKRVYVWGKAIGYYKTKKGHYVRIYTPVKYRPEKNHIKGDPE